MFSPRNIVCFLAVFLFSSQVQCETDQNKVFPTAPNCLTYECPPYTVLYAYTDYEIRIYNEATWVSGPKIPSDYYKPAAYRGFVNLFSYFHGNNKERVKINMTAPVFVYVKAKVYTVYFYVPQKYQGGSGTSLPQPLSTEITQVKLPKHKYAVVRRFDGFISDDIIAKELVGLKASLQGPTWYPRLRAPTLDEITIAGYNSPFEPFNRVNEIIVFFD